MKKRNLKSLVLRKHKISILNLLHNKGGIITTDTATDTLPSGGQSIDFNCEETWTCETHDNGPGCVTLDTTRSVGDNSFGDHCNGFNTGAAC